MLTIARLWETGSGETLAGILQVGDMGAFPDHARLDKSTARFAKRDRDELGYADYVEGRPEAARFLGDPAAPEVAWCRGNHEDFDHLGAFSSPGHVDPFERLLFVPDGQVVDLRPRHDEAGTKTRIAAFGGIPGKVEHRDKGRIDRALFRRAQAKAQDDPRCYTLGDAERAFRETTDVDVLLSHAGPRCGDFLDGSTALAGLCERVRPRVHLFGHHHCVVPPTEGPGGSLLVGLEHLEFERATGTLRDGSCGLLTLPEGDGAPSFRFFDSRRDPWWTAVHPSSYRQLFPGWT